MSSTGAIAGKERALTIDLGRSRNDLQQLEGLVRKHRQGAAHLTERSVVAMEASHRAALAGDLDEAIHAGCGGVIAQRAAEQCADRALVTQGEIGVVRNDLLRVTDQLERLGELREHRVAEARTMVEEAVAEEVMAIPHAGTELVSLAAPELPCSISPPRLSVRSQSGGAPPKPLSWQGVLAPPSGGVSLGCSILGGGRVVVEARERGLNEIGVVITADSERSLRFLQRERDRIVASLAAQGVRPEQLEIRKGYDDQKGGPRDNADS